MCEDILGTRVRASLAAINQLFTSGRSAREDNKRHSYATTHQRTTHAGQQTDDSVHTQARPFLFARLLGAQSSFLLRLLQDVGYQRSSGTS